MTSETPNLHVSKKLNISKTKQDIEKLKTPLRLVWNCCSGVFKIGSKIFSLQWHFNRLTYVLLELECKMSLIFYNYMRPHKQINHFARNISISTLVEIENQGTK